MLVMGTFSLFECGKTVFRHQRHENEPAFRRDWSPVACNLNCFRRCYAEKRRLTVAFFRFHRRGTRAGNVARHARGNRRRRHAERAAAAETPALAAVLSRGRRSHRSQRREERMRQGGAALAAREAPSIFRGGPIVARRRLGPRFKRGRPRRCRAQDPDDAPRAAQLRGRAAERATDTAQEPPAPRRGARR